MDTKNKPQQKPVLGYSVSDLAITEIILRDFDHSWEYYKFNLEERREIISRIYNFVGMPIAVVSAVYFLSSKGILIPKDVSKIDYPIIYAIISSAIWLYGQIQIVALALESSVSRNYLNFLNNVRQYVGIQSPELRPYLKLNDYEAQLNFYLTNMKNQNEDVVPFDKMSHVSSRHLHTLSKKSRMSSLEQFIEYIKNLKSTYWRTASAIYIVSLSFGCSVTSGILFFPSYANEVVVVLCFIAASALCFALNSAFFRRVAGLKKRGDGGENPDDIEKIGHRLETETHELLDNAVGGGYPEGEALKIVESVVRRRLSRLSTGT
jgi:hypothetical protein